MDEDGIGLVLARASELRSKITNCIQNSSSPAITTDGLKHERETEEDEEAESLLNVRDAFESLEAQLSSLQAFQQQQLYEKEASLAEIDYSRKKLLQKLNEYKGDDGLEVIHEATAFASSTVEIENHDLLLPPYPSRPSRSLAADNGFLSHFLYPHKISQNGTSNELKGSINQSNPRSSINGWRRILGAATKTIFTLVGLIAVLSLSGFEPKLGKRESEFKALGLLGEQLKEEKRSRIVKCPPGKILVVEDGETRCLVKERVEIPFDSAVTTPNVTYGCG